MSGSWSPMAELAGWLRTEARRQAERPDLLAALLSGGSFAYARHRLGFMAMRMLLRTGIHAIEIQLFVLAFVPWEYLAPLIAYRAVCSMVAAAHWGALEALRERVRESVRRRRPEAARGAVEVWLGLTLWAACAGVMGTLAFEIRSALRSGVVNLRDAYAIACVLRLGLDSVLRVLHSGVFAVRRVYRPLWSTLLPDLVELAVIVFGFSELGLWSIPLATLAGGASDNAFAYAFIRRAHLQRRLQLPSSIRALRVALRVRAAELAAAGRHAVANLSLQLDGALLLMLAHAGHAGRSAASFATLYYVLRPLMAAGAVWVRTFYFDLKLIESGALRAFRPQLLRFLWRLAWLWSALLAVITLALAHLLLGAPAGLPLLVLLPFFLVRSTFAMVQIVAFGAGDLKRLVRLGVFVLGGLLACRAVGLRGTGLLSAVTLLLAAAVIGARRFAPLSEAAAVSGVFDLCAWLSRVRASPSVQLAVLHVDARSARVGAIVRGLRLAYPQAAITRWGRRHVLLAVPASQAPSSRALIVACGGALQSVWVSPPDAPLASFERARIAGALPDGWIETSRRAAAGLELRELEQQFHASFPRGEVCDLESGRGLSVRPVSAAILRQLVSAIQARSRGHEARSERALPFLIAVYAPRGQARSLFVAAKSAPDFDVFRSKVQSASVRASWPELFTQVVTRESSSEVPAVLYRGP